MGDSSVVRSNSLSMSERTIKRVRSELGSRGVPIETDNNLGDLSEAFDIAKLRGRRPTIPASDASMPATDRDATLCNPKLFGEWLHQRGLREHRSAADPLPIAGGL